jgi:hypothetical protein
MAAAAELIQFEQSYATELGLQLVDADTIPELQFSRLRAAREAASVMEQNRQYLRQGGEYLGPIPVDAIGTARRVVETGRAYSKDSNEYHEAFAGLLLDSSRLFAEAARKNTWEFFPESAQQFDDESGGYFSHGVAMLEILAAGLSPMAEPEDRDRRINEFVEEKTYHAVPQIKTIGRLGMQGTVSLQTISECPDFAIEAFESNSSLPYGGYVPQIKKLMVRGVRFSGENERHEATVGVSGRYITHEVILSVLQEAGGVKEEAQLTKTQLHSKQFIDLQGGNVLDTVARLDERASIVSGLPIFMGEVLPADNKKDYAGIAAQAEARRESLAQKSYELAEYLIQLEENKTDRWAAEKIVERFVENVLFPLAKADITQAEIIFDKATADGLREVAVLHSQGDYAQANARELEVRQNAPTISYCGAGSCGLEAVAMTSTSAKKAKELGLKGELLHDIERACPDCKTLNVYYDMKGGKACVFCKKNNKKVRSEPTEGKLKQNKK